MAVQKYAVLDAQGAVVNVILWDGDVSKWSPSNAYGVGFTARIAGKSDENTGSVPIEVDATVKLQQDITAIKAKLGA